MKVTLKLNWNERYCRKLEIAGSNRVGFTIHSI